MFSNPAIIFDRDYIEGTISSVYGDCNASSVASFDAANYILALSFDVNEFKENPICMAAMVPEDMGYDPIYDGDEFKTNIDVRSLMTVIALNVGILDVSQLQNIGNATVPYYYNNITYAMGSYYDTRYDG